MDEDKRIEENKRLQLKDFFIARIIKTSMIALIVIVSFICLAPVVLLIIFSKDGIPIYFIIAVILIVVLAGIGLAIAIISYEKELKKLKVLLDKPYEIIQCKIVELIQKDNKYLLLVKDEEGNNIEVLPAFKDPKFYQTIFINGVNDCKVFRFENGECYLKYEKSLDKMNR